MSPLSRVLAVPIVLLGVAAAVALPNGYTCGEGTVLEVHRLWSFGQERWFYGCYLPPELIQSQGGTEFHPFHPMDAMADRRIPLRIGAVLAGLVLARAVLFVVERMATGGPSDNQLPRPTAGTGILVAVSTLLGAAIAVLVTLRREEYWVRAADGSGFPTRSILGWETTPILAEVAVAIVGAAGGAVLGLLVLGLYRRLGPYVAMTIARDSS